MDKTNYNEYIKIFWVGLMDGAGSIQVNHWESKRLQYRLVIKLSNIKSNYNMLIKIAMVIGGTVIITNKGKDVIWVENKKEIVEEIIKIYDTYPPLTSKKICQLAFFKRCLTGTSSFDSCRATDRAKVSFLLNRNIKYDKQLSIINQNLNFNLPCYFKSWLSGFIEAEGCFSSTKGYLSGINNHTFSIGLNYDLYLLEAIKDYFESTIKIIKPYPLYSCPDSGRAKGKLYLLVIYKKEIILNIITHCTNYPLLGEKREALEKFN